MINNYSVNCITGCWDWQGCLTHNGYGQGTIKNKRIRAHRYFYLTYNGPIPEGYFVLHSCDNRKCVNPKHLFLGTAKDNTQDMLLKGRHVAIKKTRCLRDHDLTLPNAKGASGCRQCQKIRELKARIRMKLSTIAYLIGLCIFSGCGIDVHGKIDTSGTNTVKVDLSGINDFFIQVCEDINGPSATKADLNDCVSKMAQDFSKYLSKNS